MRNPKALIAVLLVGFGLIAASCSTTSEVTADEPPGVTPTPELPVDTEGDGGDRDTEGSGDTSDPDAPRTVPPFSLPAVAPGSNAAYDDMIAELERFLTPEQLATVPWPDLRNPDPIAAYRSCAEFQNWMTENNTSPSLVEAYTAAGSPERGWDVEMFATWELFDALSTPSEPPYSMDVRGVVHPAATDITDALLAQVPEGSAAVVYWDSVGRSQMIGPDGSILSQSDGWSDLGPWVAIMAPTDFGWQVWWDELTETPPLGLDDDRGLPQTPEPRRDV